MTLAPVTPYFRPIYYRPTARVSPFNAVGMLFLACTAALFIGAIYGVLDVLNHFTILHFIVTLFAGFAHALALAVLIRRGKIHNLLVAMIIASTATVVLLVASWEAWLYALVEIHHNLSPLRFILHPQALFIFMKLFYQHGAWRIFDINIDGPLLALIWLIEAALLSVWAFPLVFKSVSENPFCTHCNNWCGSRSLVNLPLVNQAELRNQLENKNFAAIGAAGISPEEARRFLHVYLQGCPTCDTTQTLCVDYTTLTTNDRGVTQLKYKPVVHRLLITSEETVQIAGIVAAMEPPPPDPDDAPHLTPADHTPALSASAFRSQKPDLSP